ncbi:hypothetical protein chiPu_0019520 [Chiloscyllium punctatum]|uniref:Ig-like domain-containing protein n=1 Tax=Chiloscyllium punctatum TaxID=137246 RepID=A0A401RSC2_CHIPU|nr:hypothetical protein [Chiloscyllium punctatum]
MFWSSVTEIESKSEERMHQRITQGISISASAELYRTVHVLIMDAEGRNVELRVDPVSPLEGERLKLKCRNKYYIRWKKDSCFYKNGVKIHAVWLQGRESSYSIKVNSIDDSGLYSCKIGGSESQNVKVQVRERFAKPVLRVEPAPEVFEGLLVTLTCTVPVAQPSVHLHYSFYRDGAAREAVPGHDSMYTINAATVNVSGNYACEAIETVHSLRKRSDSIHISIKLPVTDAVLIYFINGTEIQSGDRLVLQCRVREGTEPQFLWYHDNMLLRNGSASYHVTADGGELVIHSFQRDNVGRTGSQPSGEAPADSNLEYAVVGAAHNAENTTADLIYSKVTIKKRKEPGKDLFASVLRLCEMGLEGVSVVGEGGIIESPTVARS